jgi:hypothetical protein
MLRRVTWRVGVHTSDEPVISVLWNPQDGSSITLEASITMHRANEGENPM